jgi:uncharacterized membrane protein YbhN (UPF0104 family)
VVVVAFVAAFVAREWDAVREGLQRLDAASLAGSLAAVLVGLAAAMMSWRAVLVGLGSRLPVLAAARVFFLGQLGKYVPGSVWPVVAQAELSQEYGVPRARAGIASLAQMLVGLVVGVVVAGAALATSSPDAVSQYWWLLPVAAAGAVVLVPPVFARLCALAARLARRPAPVPVDGRTILAAAAWCLVMWAAFGLHLYLLVRAAGTGTGSASTLLLASTGGYALAWVVGFVIVFLPAGAGAREAALVLALAPVLPGSDALALALVSRFLMLAGDGLTAGVAVLAARRHGSGRGAAVTPAVTLAEPPPSKDS